MRIHPIAEKDRNRLETWLLVWAWGPCWGQGWRWALLWGRELRGPDWADMGLLSPCAGVGRVPRGGWAEPAWAGSALRALSICNSVFLWQTANANNILRSYLSPKLISKFSINQGRWLVVVKLLRTILLILGFGFFLWRVSIFQTVCWNIKGTKKLIKQQY